MLPSFEVAPGDVVVEVECGRIEPNPHQPRRQFDEAKLEELAASVAARGILQPVIVRPMGDRYQLVAGERRWRAAVRAGLERVPAVVRELSDSEMLELALVENLQREDLNPLEEARAYRALIDQFGWTQEELAQRLGRSRPAITNALRLLTLDAELQAGVERGALSAGHARALLAVPERQARLRLAEEIQRRGWSVRQAEDAVRRAAGPREGGGARARRQRDPALAAVEERLRQALGTRVRIVPGSRKGLIEIEYFGDADLERLVELLAAPRST